MWRTLQRAAPAFVPEVHEAAARMPLRDAKACATSRRGFLLAAVGGTACSQGHATASPLGRAVEFLWAQQADDGGFHSKTYGLLKSGQSLTPFVLDALLDAPAAPPAPAGAVDKSVAFIQRNLSADGSLGLIDKTAADYPNYATALAVCALVKAKRDVAPLVASLRAQQFSEDNGWKPSDAPYGAWGMGGPIHRPPETGHVDLSMTRYVLEALRAARVPGSDAAMRRAVVYLERSQNLDGGFLFSQVDTDLNKAGGQSYGTATADGVLALRAAGVADADPRIDRALKWLRQHHRPDRAPGFEVAPYLAWATGLRYYYAAAVSRAAPGLPVLLPPQRQDGSYWNSNNLVKEDDPLIATAFAVRVLSR
jgi:squalene-hopene/tetraprenyl-beta-curcumene cyclase